MQEKRHSADYDPLTLVQRTVSARTSAPGLQPFEIFAPLKRATPRGRRTDNLTMSSQGPRGSHRIRRARVHDAYSPCHTPPVSVTEGGSSPNPRSRATVTHTLSCLERDHTTPPDTPPRRGRTPRPS